MSLLPPRIGEVEEHPPHAAVGTEPGEREPRVLAEHARVLAEAVLRQTPIADGRPLATDFEADEESLGRRRSALEEKPSFWPRTDLELDPLAGAEQPKVDLVALGQARRVRIRSESALLLRRRLAFHARRLDAASCTVKATSRPGPRGLLTSPRP